MRGASLAAGACRLLVRATSLLVPSRRRLEWRREWEAELAFVSRPAHRAASGLLLRRTLGAPVDALSLLREDWNFDMLFQDLRHAFRALALRPGFTVIAVVTLALGIGASTAIFSIVDTVLLDPLPYEKPHELVRIYGIDTVNPDGLGNLNPLDVRDWRNRTELLDGIAWLNEGTMTLSGDGAPLRLQTGLATANFFDLMGVEPLVGRAFAPDEDELGNHRAAILGHAFWQQRFGADPDVVGTDIVLSGFDYRVIGVLPPEFINPIADPGEPPLDLWRPLVYAWDEVGRGGHFMYAIGRLGEGTNLPLAQEEMDRLAALTAEEFPANAKGRGAALVPLRESIVGEARPALMMMSGAVAFVLLIACGNVANLVLARGVSRRRELAVRAALGAGRSRLIRQLLIEATVLALFAGAVGTVAARFTLAAVAAGGAGNLPRLQSITLDSGALAFALLISLATALLFGLIPALLISRDGLSDALKDQSRSSAGRAQNRLRGGLVVAEIALSIVLLAGAALMVQTLWGLFQVEPGFDPENVLSLRISLAGDQYGEDAARASFYRDLEAGLATLPGVTSVGAANMLPFTGAYSCDSFGLEDRPAPPEGEEPCAETRVVSHGYFETMRVPLMEGRFLTESDNAETNPVILINQAMVDTYWPDGEAVGQRFRYGSRDAEGEPWRTIVGVVGDVRHFGYREQMRPTVYFPYVDWAWSSMYPVMRFDRDPLDAVAGVRAVVAEIDPTLPVYRVATMDQRMADSVAAEAMGVRILVGFAAVALMIATIGLYGVLAYNVSLRRHEIGLRMALGARGRDVVALVTRRGTALAAVGVALGVVGAAGLTRVLASLLYGVSPTDPLTLAAVAAMVMMVAVLASLLPARRAARVDPLVALRR